MNYETFTMKFKLDNGTVVIFWNTPLAKYKIYRWWLGGTWEKWVLPRHNPSKLWFQVSEPTEKLNLYVPMELEGPQEIEDYG